MSEKKLQDYIPYYIGCRCLNTWFPSDHPTYNAGWVLRGYRSTYEKCYFLDNEEDETWTDSIKPLLRRLESITDEETKEYHKLMFQRTDGVHVIQISTETPESYNYLLKKHFDIFSLIDSGLAIDSATLPKIN